MHINEIFVNDVESVEAVKSCVSAILARCVDTDHPLANQVNQAELVEEILDALAAAIEAS